LRRQRSEISAGETESYSHWLDTLARPLACDSAACALPRPLGFGEWSSRMRPSSGIVIGHLTSTLPEASMRKKIQDGVFLIFVLALFALVFNRIHYGVDLTDEAYSNAIPYRFALGDTPFIDEVSPQQTSSFLLFPIIKIYTLLFGTEFLILFMRYMYLLFAGMMAFMIYQSIRERMGGKLSLLISLAVVLFAPFGAIFFNYNRLAFLMFSAGCFIGVLRRDKMFWSGIIHGLTMIAYPFFAIPCAAFFLIQVLRDRSFKNLNYVYGSLLPLSAFLLIVLWIGFDKLLEIMWSLRSGIHGGGIEKVNRLVLGIWNQIQYKELILLYCLGVFILFRRYKPASLALVLVMLIPFLAFKFSSPAAPSWYFIVYGLFAPYLMLFVNREDAFLRSVFWGIWVPSFVAGMTTGFISAAGSVSFGIGIVPGVLVTSILLVSILREGTSALHRYMSVFVPASILIVLLVIQYNFVYSEGKYSKLSETIESGPYRGLHTSVQKKQYLNSIIRDFDKFNLDDGKVLFFDFFPAGYLFTTMKPASNAVWLLSPEQFDTGRDLTLRYYENSSNLPDVAVKINLIYTFTGSTLKLEYAENDALVEFVKQVNSNVYRGKYCEIYYDR
jgi:hypothetical protein